MDARVNLQSALAGRYDVSREIGQGGMATVYLARDLRHDRQVALKVLRPELGAVLGVERFLSEIRVTANLQHPNLLPLFDSGASTEGAAPGILYYVMPFVEGETLRKRLERETQLPVDEAVRITAAVASALDYAHRRGVVHRDLKPENVLLHEGQPLVADFGIALAVSNAGGERVTQTGLSLGTPQYMSPEQATGDRQIDARSDIYSLGAMLYEMLIGEPPHTGPTLQAIIARVLTDTPRSVRGARPAVPPHIDAAIAKSLEKVPADRFTTAAQFAEALRNPYAIALTSGVTTPSTVGVPLDMQPAATRRRIEWRVWAPWGVGLALGLGGAALGAMFIASRPHEPDRTVRFAVPIKASPSCIAVSPNGARVIFDAGTPGSELYVRTLDEERARPLPGTAGALHCFFSPDGQWIGFWADGRLQRVPIAGGLPSTIATVEEFAEATWGSQDVIVFTKGLGSPLYQVPAAGGAVRALTKIEFPLDVSHRAPSFLPDGKTMVFSIEIGSGRWNLAIASLDGRVTKLGQAGLRPQYLRGDRILFSTLDGIVNVVPFDPGRRVVTGSAVAVLDVDTRPDGSVSLGASESGTIAYIRARRLSAVVYISALGDVQTVPMEPRRMRHPRLSPDGNRIVAEVLSGANSGDIWSYDLKAKTFTRLTFDGHSSDPIWTPDGKRIAYTRLDSANGSAAIRGYWLAADGSGSPELLVGGASASWPTAFTPDGHTLVFDEATSINVPMHVSAMTVGKNDARQIIASTQFGNRLPALSPDGRWIAYTTGETGRQEVFVRPFDTTARVGAGKWQVSTAGGTDAVWARDGRTLFYRDGTHVIAVMVHTVPTFTVINRRSIVDDHFIADLGVNMDAAPNGKLVALSPAEAATELSVVVNWLNEVDRRLGQKK